MSIEDVIERAIRELDLAACVLARWPNRGWYGSDAAPAFWFGAGLGWGTWDYRSAEHQRADNTELLTVVLANTANRVSREVVQVYWRPEGSAPPRLVGYAIADEVVPGEQRTVTVECDPRAFRLWDEAATGWGYAGWRHVARGSRPRRHSSRGATSVTDDAGPLTFATEPPLGAAQAVKPAETWHRCRADPHR